MNSKTEIPYSLVLHPNSQEFANFAEFWEKIEQDPNTANYGLIKVGHFPAKTREKNNSFPSGRSASRLGPSCRSNRKNNG